MGRRKRGWKVLSKFSVADLQRLIESKESEVAKLTAKRDALASDLADVEAELAAAGGGGMVKRGPGRPPKLGRRGPGRPPKAGRGPGRPKGKRRGRKAGPKGQSELHNAIRSALSGASEPMRLADIAEKVKRGGYESKSKHFPIIIGQRLTEMRDVKKAGRGLYAMK